MKRIALLALCLYCLSQAIGSCAELNAVVKRYSQQQIIGLNPGEEYQFTLKSGEKRTIRLVSVIEHRDSVINLVRSADVAVRIDGKPLNLTCAPYTMPTVASGLRIQADKTSGLREMPKRVQFSAWDASDPIIDTAKFGFPILNYRLFSHGTQAFAEPVHLGLGDGDPAGGRFPHDYGMDMAGFEGGEEVVSATDGEVTVLWPSRENLCSIVVEDPDGFTWEYAHLISAMPDITVGTHVKRGQKIGILGKTGPSGNFAHLHLGTYLSHEDMVGDRMNYNLNLYPWLVTAYQSAHSKSLLAVARPHHTVLTGERVLFDGSNSLAFGTKIVSWQWTLPDGQVVNSRRAVKTFDNPGSYVATLRIRDAHGREDVDFCQIRVFSKPKPEDHMPTIFMTFTPTEDARANQPVRFRLWLQSENQSPITVDFGDGTQIENYESYKEITHAFRKPAIHIVTAKCVLDGKPITSKLKVVTR